jgi:hypothetical protein
MRARCPGSSRRRREVSPGFGIRIDVRRHLEPLGPRGVDLRDHRVGLLPVRLAARVDVADVRAHLGLPGDAERLIQRFEHPVGLRPHRHFEQAVELGDDRSEGGELRSGGKRARRCRESRPQAQRSFAHRHAHHFLHFCQFLRSRYAAAFADHRPPHVGVADERGEVDAGALLLDVAEILGERSPFHIELILVLAFPHQRLQLRRERAWRLAFREHFQRHALIDVAESAAVDRPHIPRERDEVDEARADRQPRGIDLPRGFMPREISDGHDAIRLDADVGLARIGAAAVVQRAVAHDQVERLHVGRAVRGWRAATAPRHRHHHRENQRCEAWQRPPGEDRPLIEGSTLVLHGMTPDLFKGASPGRALRGPARRRYGGHRSERPVR